MKAILNFDHMDLNSQIVRNDYETSQSYEIVGSISKKSPQFNQSWSSSKDYSMRNICDCKEIKDASSHECIALVHGINEDNLKTVKEEALEATEEKTVTSNEKK